MRRAHEDHETTTLAKLVGRTLPNGTRITVRAGREARTLVIRGGKVR